MDPGFQPAKEPLSSKSTKLGWVVFAPRILEEAVGWWRQKSACLLSHGDTLPTSRSSTANQLPLVSWSLASSIAHCAVLSGVQKHRMCQGEQGRNTDSDIGHVDFRILSSAPLFCEWHSWDLDRWRDLLWSPPVNTSWVTPQSSVSTNYPCPVCVDKSITRTLWLQVHIILLRFTDNAGFFCHKLKVFYCGDQWSLMLL